MRLVRHEDDVEGGPAIRRAAVGMGLYAAAFGLTFGAVATGSGLTVGQAAVLSVVMFSGASQFALAGVVAAGGSGLAAIGAALLLGLRNSFYGVPVTEILRPRGLRRLWTAHFVIDETTGMAVAQPTPRAARYAFWVVGLVLFIGWAAGTLAGAVVGRGLDTEALGLDAAALEASWRSLREAGNLSSASILLVLEDVMRDAAPPPGGHGLMIAMGPGFCSELVLLRW